MTIRSEQQKPTDLYKGDPLRILCGTNWNFRCLFDELCSPFLRSLILTIWTSSLLREFYQTDERVNPGHLLWKLSSPYLQWNNVSVTFHAVFPFIYTATFISCIRLCHQSSEVFCTEMFPIKILPWSFSSPYKGLNWFSCSVNCLPPH
jgi:hypothetical protein